jgi:hypothetical protein
VECVISWPHVASVGSVKTRGRHTTREELIVETIYGTHFIGSDVFNRSVDEVQDAITDFQRTLLDECQGGRSRRQRVLDYCRTRFRTPVRVSERNTRKETLGDRLVLRCLAIFVLLVVLFGVSFLVFGLVKELLNVNMNDGLLWVLIFLGLFVGAAGTWILFRPRKGKRIIELRAEGIALGYELSELQLIPWESVLYAQIVEKDNTPDFPIRDSLDLRRQIRIRKTDRSWVRLSNIYDRSLEDLVELIDPPHAKVALAYERALTKGKMVTGQELETAAVAEGLPALDKDRLQCLNNVKGEPALPW